LSGKAKDVASAAVFLSVLLAAGVWGFSIWTRFFSS
jgi:diacylglycerol kinase